MAVGFEYVLCNTAGFKLMSQSMNVAQLPFLFRKELEMCRVGQDTRVVLVTDMTTPHAYIDAAFAAGKELGAKIFEVKVPTAFNNNMIASQDGGEILLSLPGAIDAIHASELALVFHPALGSTWMKQACERGVRVLLVLDGPDELARLMSPPGLKEAVTYARDLSLASKKMHVTSEAGTDFTATFGKLNAVAQWGYADEPGRFDTWGGAHFSIWPNDDASEGVVVLSPGDAWILPYVRYFEGEVRLQVEKGYITKVEGRSADARLMRQFFENHKTTEDDRRPYAISHLGWGLNPNSYFDQIAMHSDIGRISSHTRSWPGVFLFSTGPNDQGGGKNATPAHLDLPMFDCTVTLDDKLVIDKGLIVDPKMIVKRTFANKLAG